MSSKNYLLKYTEENKKWKLFVIYQMDTRQLEASYNMAVEYADAGCKMMEVDLPFQKPIPGK